MKPRIECAHTDVMSIEELKLRMHPDNENKHTKKQIEVLAKIIDKNGQRSPIVISKRSDKVTKGHGRILAMEFGKFEEAAVDYQDYDSEEAEFRDRVADNEIARYAEFDKEQFELNLQGLDLELEEFDFEEVGLIDFNFGPTAITPKDEDFDEEQEMAQPKTTVAGDVWILGKHRLMCGDSTSLDDLAKLTDGQYVDLWLTDPPYNVAYTGKTKDALTIQNDSMEDGDFREFLKECYLAADSVMRPGAVFYIWHADSEGYNFRGAASDIGWQIRQCLIWQKNTIVMGRQDYHWKHEPCLYGWKDGAAHFWGTDRKQTTLLEFNKPQRNDIHPTMKPVELFEYQMMNSSKKGGRVLDSFCGSGTTIIAAEKCHRIAYGMELDPKYCDVIVKRWEAFTEQKATLEASGETFEDVKTRRGE